MESYMKDNFFAYFPENYRWSSGVLMALSTSPWGSSDIGAIDKVGRRLKGRVGDDEAWFNEWSRMGEDLENRGREAAAKGLGVTASGYLQRACMYYQTGERFRQPKDDKALEVYQRSINCFKDAAKHTDQPSIEYVEIPYEGGKFLPAIFVKNSRDQNSPMPTVIFFDGLDVTKEICYFFGVRDMVRRGVNCILVDGPGNGESIRFRGLKLRYDYEAVAGAVVDYLEGRKDVNSKRIGIMAISLGGYYAPRAAAFEKRLKACVAWGAEWDYRENWIRRIKAAYKTALSVPKDHILWVLGVSTMDDALKKLEKFKLEGVVDKIECPFLLVHGEDDAQAGTDETGTFYRTADARACFKEVGSKDKTFKVFTAEEGAAQHCNLDYLGIVLPYMHDWLAEKLKS